MTDNGIIKAFERCTLSDCDNDICQKTGFCCVYLYKKVFDLIKRQQVEIDRLKEKQMPQKPIEDGYYNEPCVCPNCGQTLDWSDYNER